MAYAETSYGQSLDLAFIAAYTRDGGRVYDVGVSPEDAERNTTAAVARVMSEVAARKADGLFVASTEMRFIGELVKAAKAAPRKISIFLADGGMDPTVAKLVGAGVMAGVRGSNVALGDPAFVADFKDFAKAKGRNVSYVSNAAYAYDATAALIEAYRRAADPKGGPEVLAELAGVRLAKGKSGIPISFDEAGDAAYQPGLSYEVTEFEPSGQLKSLGPKATARRRRAE